MLMIYNSMTKTKQVFEPLHQGNIRMYVCGVTVYDHCHLGHARAMVCFDVIVRFLRFLNYKVTFVRNITDIDDKIIRKAESEGVPIEQITARYIASMHEDMQALGCDAPDIEPRATEAIEQMIECIQGLMAQGIAYQTVSGDVCFEVATFKAYGQLSRKILEDLCVGVRIESSEEKRSPLDFVLWKAAKVGEPCYPSPFGPGRPGWHIECSAMVKETLGNTIDIHGGGLDLQFPHHENEIAQSEALNHAPFARYWMHIGLLELNQEKMSKSTGNFLTIKDSLLRHSSEVLRYFLLTSHYRSPLNYTEEALIQSKKALTRLYLAIRGVDYTKGELVSSWVEAFAEAMSDDFNTPVALSVLFELSHALNRSKDSNLAYTLVYLAQMLGLLTQDPTVFLQEGLSFSEQQEILALIEARSQARAVKAWARADEIRALLMTKGIEIEDTADGTIWRTLLE